MKLNTNNPSLIYENLTNLQKIYLKQNRKKKTRKEQYWTRTMAVAHNPRTAFLRRKNQSNERSLWLCGIHSWKLQIQTEFRSWSQPQSSICIACRFCLDNTSRMNSRWMQEIFGFFFRSEKLQRNFLERIVNLNVGKQKKRIETFFLLIRKAI